MTDLSSKPLASFKKYFLRDSASETEVKDETSKSATAIVTDNKAEKAKETKLAKESDSDDLVIKKQSDKESEVKTKAKESTKAEVEKHESISIPKEESKHSVKPTAKPEVKPVVKPESKPEPKPETKPDKKKVWVVDQEAIPAWDEKVDNYDFPIGEDREYYWIEGRGVNEKYYSGKELNKRLDELAEEGIAVSWGNGQEFIQSGYMKQTIHHPAVPEKGHWEWK